MSVSGLADPSSDPQELLDSGRSVAAVAAASQRVLEHAGAVELAVLGRCLLAAKAPRRALAAFLTALDAVPRTVDLRVDLHLGAAAAFRRMGRLPEAIESFQDVLELVPEHSGAHGGLAVAYAVTGSLTLAGTHLRRVDREATPVPEFLPVLIETGRPPQISVRGASQEILEVGPAVRVDTGGSAAANETSVAATSAQVPRLVIGWNDDRVSDAALGVGLSDDGGASWEDSLLEIPDGIGDDLSGDPMTAFDRRTGDLWIGGIAFGLTNPNGLVVARWPAAGTLEPAVVVNQDPGFVDKCWMTAGAAPGDPDATRVYVAYSLGLQSSADQGATWTPPTPLGFGNGFLPRVGPDGELYVSYRTTGGQQDHEIRRSLDGGASFEPPVLISARMNVDLSSVVPGTFRIAGFGSLAVDPRDGGLFFVFDDDSGGGDVDVFFVVSVDGGKNWSVPRALHALGEPPGDQFMPWLEIDDRGGLHLLFFDTRSTPQDDSDSDAWLDVYYAYSEDRGDSWVEARLTAAPFSTATAQFGPFLQFIGDYLGLAVSGNRAYPSYPSTAGGDLDIFVHSVRIRSIFADGFESGDVESWSSAQPGPASILN